MVRQSLPAILRAGKVTGGESVKSRCQSLSFFVDPLLESLLLLEEALLRGHDKDPLGNTGKDGPNSIQRYPESVGSAMRPASGSPAWDEDRHLPAGGLRSPGSWGTGSANGCGRRALSGWSSCRTRCLRQSNRDLRFLARLLETR